MICRKIFPMSLGRVYATSLPEDFSDQGSEPPSTSGRGNTSPIQEPAWKRVLIAALVAEGIFLLGYLGGIFLPLLIWPGSLAFLPVGIWLGRKSRRPWVEGALYGLITTVVVALLLFLDGFPWGSLYALFLVLPQGILGTWLGARLLPAQDNAHR